jgi:ubiquinone/menaquinone biosynthesis C-methylase UbiE
MAHLDYEQASHTYDRGRAFDKAVYREWRDALGEFWPRDLDGVVLDLGAGTGIWLEALSGWFDEPIIAVEPSAGMRSVAARRVRAGTCALIAGEAQHLPVGDGSCKVVWLSTVIHHLADLRQVAGQIHRAMASGGMVFIRNSFPGRHDEIALFHFFPKAGRIASTFPTVDEVVQSFISAGFEFVTLRRIHEHSDESVSEMVERIRAMRHADTALAPLSDEEFADGLKSLMKAMSTTKRPPPLGLDLLVLRSL